MITVDRLTTNGSLQETHLQRALQPYSSINYKNYWCTQLPPASPSITSIMLLGTWFLYRDHRMLEILPTSGLPEENPRVGVEPHQPHYPPRNPFSKTFLLFWFRKPGPNKQYYPHSLTVNIILLRHLPLLNLVQVYFFAEPTLVTYRRDKNLALSFLN